MYGFEERIERDQPQPGECYCHLSMHSEFQGHSARPCHFCEAEVNADLARFDEEAEQAKLQSQLDYFGAISALDLETIQPCAPRGSMNHGRKAS